MGEAEGAAAAAVAPAPWLTDVDDPSDPPSSRVASGDFPSHGCCCQQQDEGVDYEGHSLILQETRRSYVNPRVGRHNLAVDRVRHA